MENVKQAYKSGDYCVDGVATDLPVSIGLEVKDFGPVSIPLVESTAAQNLIKYCRQAPFGKNTQTLVDKNVRDSYQLEPSQVKITNPQWNAKLAELVRQVAKGLGCYGEVEVLIFYLF